MFPAVSTFAIIKTCALGAVLLGLYLWARGHGVESTRKESAAIIAAKNRALTESGRTLAAVADILDAVNQEATRRKQAADDMALRADHADKAAAVDKADYTARIGSLVDELARAKQQDSCRAQLEQTLCAPLH
jgi:hypothetical protein